MGDDVRVPRGQQQRRERGRQIEVVAHPDHVVAEPFGGAALDRPFHAGARSVQVHPEPERARVGFHVLGLLVEF
ncbi:hypothetical protein [Nonomuraea sp. KM88]|uniref:hypothetical protein n=1 Tax=Nonomuraea sp. KM88 TaxID=3457427 RepID=UPI003FCD42E5